MDSKQQLQVEYFFRGLVKEYRRKFKPSTSREYRQYKVWDLCPHLKPNRAWSRAMAEMCVVSWKNPHHTGICLPVALLAKAWFRDVLGVEVKLYAVKFRPAYRVVETEYTFFHAVVGHHGHFYDVLNPGGTSPDKIYGQNIGQFGFESILVGEFDEFKIEYMDAIFHDFILPMKRKMYPEGTTDSEFQSIFKELL